MVRQSRCPLCSGDKLAHFLNCTDHLVSHLDYELLRCSSCGFIFTAAPPDESEIGRYYESDEYISHSDSKKKFLDKVYQLVRKFMLVRKKKIIINEVRKPVGKILDIGCGTGHFLNEMKLSGWETTGVEISSKARELAVSGFGLIVIPPDRTGSLPSNEYDCITLWHVLEHFHNPFEYFSEIKRMLKPEGIVLVALPNSHSFDAHHYGKDWAAFDVPRHLWHFSPSTFKVFAEKTGFSITSVRVLPFDVFYISMLSEKHKRSAFPAFKGLILGKIYFLLSLFKRKRGSSLVYVLRVPGN